MIYVSFGFPHLKSKVYKGRVQKKKKKLEFSNRGGRGSENKKKIPTFPKTVPFYLECHDSARNVIKFFWPYVPPPPPPPPPPILLLPYIDPYVHGSLPIYSNFNVHNDL